MRHDSSHTLQELWWFTVMIDVVMGEGGGIQRQEQRDHNGSARSWDKRIAMLLFG